MRFCGELEELKMLPISPVQIAWGNGLGGLLRGLIVGYLTLLLGMLFYWVTKGELLTVHHPFLCLLFLILGGLSFANLGLAISMVASSFESINAINTFILLPLIYLGGVFFSLDQLHPFWQTLSKLNPLLYMVNGLRWVSDVNIGVALWVSLIACLLLNLLAIRSLQKGYYSRW
jgi:ABC-2 type transport system permease protein